MRALRLYREAAGLSQGELGQLIGVKQYTISQYELGVHRPRPARLMALAAAVESTPAELEVVERVLEGIAPVRQKDQVTSR